MARRSDGFTYLAILLAVAFLGISLAEAGVVWHTAAQRDREAELLFVGEAYRTAIESYFRQGGQLPQDLQDLVQDERLPVVRRYLRRLYADPMTGSVDWGLIKGPDGGITGVYSASTKTPFKRANFVERESNFTDAQCYCEWKFEFNSARATRRHKR